MTFLSPEPSTTSEIHRDIGDRVVEFIQENLLLGNLIAKVTKMLQDVTLARKEIAGKGSKNVL